MQAISLKKKCPIYIDGFYIETAICLIFGLIWYKWGVSTLRRLQEVPLVDWRVVKTNSEEPK